MLGGIFSSIATLFLAAIEPGQPLARKIRNSDTGAFRQAFELFQERIFAFLYYKLGDQAAAEDIVQEVFVKLWENRHQLKEELSLKSYLYTIANNLAINHLKHATVVRKFEEDAAHSQPASDSPHDELEKKELREQLLSILGELPEKSRIVFMMSRFDALAYQEIANRLGISIKTVESHMGKALKYLRKALIGKM